MVLIISWWVQPTVIWPYKACSLSWAASNVWYMLKFLLPGSSKTFLNSVMSCSSSSFERMYCGCSWKKVSACSLVCLYFRKKCLSWLRYFLMRNYQRYGLIMIYSSQGLTAHTEETDTHQYYLRWPVALSERQVAVPVCSRRKGGAPEHSRSVKRQEDSYKIFSY